MNINFELVAIATIPALIVGLVSYFAIETIVKKETIKQKYSLLKNNQKEVLPLKLQAFERLTLFLDRISLQKLLIRIAPVSEEVTDYKNLLIATIDQEFEHNLTQQIYVSDESWRGLIAAKNTIIAQLHKVSQQDNLANASEFREKLLMSASESNAITIAQSMFRAELRDLFR